MTTTHVKKRATADDLSDRYLRHWEHVRVKKDRSGEYDVSYCCSTWPALRQFMKTQKCTCMEDPAP